MIGKISYTKVGSDTLEIEVAFDKTNAMSKTGKSRMLASTQGFITCGDMQLSLNLIRKI